MAAMSGSPMNRRSGTLRSFWMSKSRFSYERTADVTLAMPTHAVADGQSEDGDGKQGSKRRCDGATILLSCHDSEIPGVWFGGSSQDGSTRRAASSPSVRTLSCFCHIFTGPFCYARRLPCLVEEQ